MLTQNSFLTHRSFRPVWFALLFVWLSAATMAQTTAFTYQGNLTTGGNPASGDYDLQFRLFDALTGGNQVGAPFTNPIVPVTGGIFSVQLDFGAAAFDGSARFLEIGVRQAGNQDPYTVLSPRQPITSTPYSIKSTAADGLSAACVNCVTNGQIQTLDGAKITGEIPTESVPMGSGNYIQNASSLPLLRRNEQQPAASFNIDGDGVIGGSLGIGTPELLGRLHLFDPGSVSAMYLSTGSGIEGPARFRVQADSGLGGQGKSFVIFDDVAATYRMVINGAGNIGFGITTPTGRLHAHSAGATSPLVLSTGSGLEGPASFRLQADSGLGGQGRSFVIVDDVAVAYRMVINGNGNVGLGTTTPSAKLHVIGTAKAGVLEITGGLDLAEHFEVSDTAKPGLVVMIDSQNTGKLAVARGAYNRRVAGIISGANNLSAGMVLQDVSASEKSLPVALSGRVWVYCDASANPIKPGDLLTTSNVPGHAMKVANHRKAQGAIIGKAMTGLKSGRGLVLVLVTLQ